jgi:hypothetical protein
MEPINAPRRGGKFANAVKKIEAVEEDTMRPPMREDDSRAAASRRAAQLREHLGDVVDAQDDFYIPLDEIPDGWTYEWKRHTIYGQEDPAYQIQLARAGWEPVPVARHPWMMPNNTSTQTILRKGMILMQCPTEIIDERRASDLRKARMQVRAKEQQIAGTPDGTMTRDDARVKPQIKKSYEAMPIPEK